MGKTRNKKVILGIMMAITFIAGILAIEFVYADHVSSLPSARIAQSLEVLFVDIGLIKTETDKVQMVKDNQYEPFVSVGIGTTTAVCDAEGGGEDVDSIRIESTNSKAFILTSIQLAVSGAQNAGDIVQIRNIQSGGVGGTPSSVNLITSPSTLILFEALGLPTINTANTSPLQISANAGGSVKVIVACNAGTTNDIKFASAFIRVLGWKQVGDTITIVHSESL